MNVPGRGTCLMCASVKLHRMGFSICQWFVVQQGKCAAPTEGVDWLTDAPNINNVIILWKSKQIHFVSFLFVIVIATESRLATTVRRWTARADIKHFIFAAFPFNSPFFLLPFSSGCAEIPLSIIYRKIYVHFAAAARIGSLCGRKLCFVLRIKGLRTLAHMIGVHRGTSRKQLTLMICVSLCIYYLFERMNVRRRPRFAPRATNANMNSGKRIIIFNNRNRNETISCK